MQDDKLQDKHYIRRGSAMTVDTVAIGALEAFEQEFGHLWGIHLKEDELVEGHIGFRERWLKARAAILQQAEDSKKIFSKNLDKFNVSRKRVFIDFTSDDKKGKNLDE